ncbi:MAG: hypothetical protein R3E32_05500 [Chitinophagales bacterium]
MRIQNTANEIVISLPKGLMSVTEIQNLIDYFRYRELVAKSKATEAEIEALSEEINVGIAKRRAKLGRI